MRQTPPPPPSRRREELARLHAEALETARRILRRATPPEQPAAPAPAPPPEQRH
jgi:hypothetical protein